MKAVRFAIVSVLILAAASPAMAQSMVGAPEAARAAFGQAVLVTHGEVLVGEPGNTTRPGLVYVYRRGADGWTERSQLRASDAFENDGFGAALATDGDLLLVGAVRQDRGRGAVYVFRRGADGGWSQLARLVRTEAGPGSFGAAVALSGGTAVVGAPAAGGPPGAARAPGAVYAFVRDAAGAWSQQVRLAPDGTVPQDAFGAAVALSDGRLFVGAPGRSEGTGEVRQYRFDGGVWRDAGALTTQGLQSGYRFGAALALRGDELLVGAPGAGGVGAVYSVRHDADTDAWQVASRLLPFGATQQDGFGTAIAYGEEVVVGSPGTNGRRGVGFAFGRSDAGLWERAARMLVPDVAGGSVLGQAVGTEGDIAALGMAGADYGAGTVAIFEREAATRRWRLATTVASPPETIASITGAEIRCGDDGRAAMFDCHDVELLSFLSIPDLGAERGARMNDVWGWTDAETGREYVIAGRMDGTSFVDITDPLNPVVLGNLPRTPGSPGASWRDMKVYRDHAYIVADASGAHGMQVFDLTRLRDVSGAPVTFEPDAHYTRINSAHNIVINEETGFAYSVGNSSGGETCGGGLHMIDIRDPKNPTFAGCFSDPQTGRAGTGYTHDAQCVVYRGPDTRYHGREICLNANETALSIADVTDKQAPRALSRAGYPNVGYSHQGWLDEEQRYFYMNDELDEIAGTVSRTRTIIWDVSDLEDPRVAGEFLGETPASDHNLYIRGDLMYQSNYMAGLRIIDISDRRNPREVAYFDTAPFHDPRPGFAGSWSNYPYFQSGVIAVTSIGEGLFLLRKRDRRPVS